MYSKECSYIWRPEAEFSRIWTFGGRFLQSLLVGQIPRVVIVMGGGWWDGLAAWIFGLFAVGMDGWSGDWSWGDPPLMIANPYDHHCKGIGDTVTFRSEGL